MNKPRVVVCAAMRLALEPHTYVAIACGPRHFDSTMALTLEAYSEWPWELSEQGFIDQFGVFMTREEAYVVARDAGQIKYRCGGDEGVLFSENLY